jgi:hypothetical protein
MKQETLKPIDIDPNVLSRDSAFAAVSIWLRFKSGNFQVQGSRQVV